MEYKFFNQFIITYFVVLGALIGWFLVMFRKGLQLINQKPKTGESNAA